MNIQTQGKIVDYIFKNISHKYPNIFPDDLRSIIYKVLKKNKDKIKDTRQLQSMVEEKDLIWNVKERYVPNTIQPFSIARQIVRRIRNDRL